MQVFFVQYPRTRVFALPFSSPGFPDDLGATVVFEVSAGLLDSTSFFSKILHPPFGRMNHSGRLTPGGGGVFSLSMAVNLPPSVMVEPRCPSSLQHGGFTFFEFVMELLWFFRSREVGVRQIANKASGFPLPFNDLFSHFFFR